MENGKILNGKWKNPTMENGKILNGKLKSFNEEWKDRFAKGD